ncbi:hypothetical protein KFK09_000438 [Dendrobium nobile]|uniref:Uncharacterized protein n=1 Tax=Dendrobium nobile TaxID=94219 RepID=A0A8T3CES9_DENNO|nr:hypothetical protein KFK09_000438 [Dendrobium nobile]
MHWFSSSHLILHERLCRHRKLEEAVTSTEKEKSWSWLGQRKQRLLLFTLGALNPYEWRGAEGRSGS